MAEILHELGIEPRALVVNIVSFILLLWLMKRFLFGRVGAFLEERRRYVANMLAEAEQSREAAAEERRAIEARRSELLRAVDDEAKALREKAAQEAEEIRMEARKRAREIEGSARAAIEREAQTAAAQLRDEISEAAAAMARRLLRSTLTEERHRALLDAFIADVERMAAEQGSQR